MKIRNLLLVVSFLFLAAYVSISFRNLTPIVTPGTITPISPKPTNTIMPPTQTPQPAGADRVKIFLIAVGDNGVSGKQVGCGDSLVPVDMAISPTLAVLQAGLTELFKLEGQKYYGQSGLYNALYQSHLTITSLNIVNREAIISLAGTLSIAGDCDDPRIKNQLEAIALQFNTIDKVSVYINGVSLDQLLSGRG